MFNLYDVFDRSLEDLLLKAFGKKYKVPCRIWAAIERIQVVNTVRSHFRCGFSVDIESFDAGSF